MQASPASRAPLHDRRNTLPGTTQVLHYILRCCNTLQVPRKCRAPTTAHLILTNSNVSRQWLAVTWSTNLSRVHRGGTVSERTLANVGKLRR